MLISRIPMISCIAEHHLEHHLAVTVIGCCLFINCLCKAGFVVAADEACTDACDEDYEYALGDKP